MTIMETKHDRLIPVDDPFPMEELKSQKDFCRVEPRPLQLEPAALLDVEHQVAAVQVLHDEKQVGRGLEGAKEVAEERMPAPQGQHLPLDHGTFDVVVLQHHVLLQAFHRVVGPAAAQFGQQDFAEAENEQTIRLAT